MALSLGFVYYIIDRKGGSERQANQLACRLAAGDSHDQHQAEPACHPQRSLWFGRCSVHQRRMRDMF